MTCHCHTDTKTTGVHCCNIMGVAKTLKVAGGEHKKIYRADLSKARIKILVYVNYY